MGKIIMMVIDCETNGLTPSYSVLSASAIKFEYDTNTKECTILSEFDRYYYPNIQYKWPTLLETAIHYNIALDEKELHGSLYDCKITLEIFKKMLERNLINIL